MLERSAKYDIIVLRIIWAFRVLPAGIDGKGEIVLLSTNWPSQFVNSARVKELKECFPPTPFPLQIGPFRVSLPMPMAV